MRSQDFGISGIDHVDIKVRDRAKARHFFVDQLGLDVLGEGPDHTFLMFGDQVLGLRDAGKGERTQGVDHVALRVQEWTGLRNRLKRARIEIAGEKERDDSRSLFLKAPGGLRVELVYRPDPQTHACHTPHVGTVAPPMEPADPPRARRRK